MKIIILGAGQVGSSVARNLAREANDITVVDQEDERLAELREGTELKTIAGRASHPDVLMRAGIEDADLILAVTNSDETNMIACQIAHSLFHTPTRLARVRSADYVSRPELFGPNAVPVNFIISPEQLVTTAIRHLIEQPGALQILDFADGRAQLVAVRAARGGHLVGHPLRTLPERLPGVQTRVVALFRGNQAIIPNGSTVIQPNDEVFFLSAPPDVGTLLSAFRYSDEPYRKVMIAGGGNIGKQLGELVERRYHTKIIEKDRRRSRRLAESLHRTIVLHGDAADENLLIEEDIGNMDIFCALTDDDEANILSAMLAKKLGARKVLSIINRPSYVDLAQSGAIDIAVSPQQITIGALLAHVRRGDVVAVHSLRRGAAEAIEAVAHGDRRTSQVVDRQLDELPLPSGASIGVIVRGEQLIFPHGDTRIESEDHIVLFLADKRQITEVERLFQVAVTFL
jgi:trk system potassium uptake protein TrkA